MLVRIVRCYYDIVVVYECSVLSCEISNLVLFIIMHDSILYLSVGVQESIIVGWLGNPKFESKR